MKNEKNKIFLIDNHVLCRKGLKAVLADYPEFKFVGDASNCLEWELILQDNPVDMILNDTDSYKINNNEFSENFLKKISLKKLLHLPLQDDLSLQNQWLKNL